MNSASWTESRSNSITRVSSRKSCKSSNVCLLNIFSHPKRETTRSTHTHSDQFLYTCISRTRDLSLAIVSIRPITNVCCTRPLPITEDKRTTFGGRPSKEKRERERSKRGLVTDTNGFGSNASANDDERGL